MEADSSEQVENPVRRRLMKAVINAAGIIVVSGIAVPGIASLFPPETKRRWIKIQGFTLPAGDEPILVRYVEEMDVGGVKQMTEKLFYAVRAPNSKLFILSAVCTHLGCNVNWKPEQHKFVCPCHGGQYDVSGKVVKSPPPRPLVRPRFRVEDGNLYILES